MADEITTTEGDQGGDTPIHDQVQQEHGGDAPTGLTAQQEAANVDPDASVTETPGTTGVGPADLPRLGFHEGRWHKTFTVAGELSAQQVQDCVHETLLQAQNAGYVAEGNHPDVQAHTIAGSDGAPTQVIVTVAVRENRIDNEDSESADQADEGQES